MNAETETSEITEQTAERKPGDLARKAREAGKNEPEEAPTTLEKMAGATESIILADEEFRILPVTVGRKHRLDQLLAQLGEEYYQTALIYDNPEGFSKLMGLGVRARRDGQERLLAELKSVKPSELTQDQKGLIGILETELSALPERVEAFTRADARTAMRMMTVGLTQAQEEAIYKISQMFLAREIDGGLVRLSMDEVREIVPLNSFPVLLCRFLDVSDLNP